jgi:iron complex transport system substrate-binding protein
MIVALGLGHRLAAVTHECDWPPEVRGLPVVTSSRIDAAHDAAAVDAAVREAAGAAEPLFVLDEARIRALQPTVIVTQGLCEVCAVSEGEVRRLARVLPDPALVVTLEARTLDEVLESLPVLANALGAGEPAELVVQRLRERLRQVHETLKAARAPRPRVAVIEWTDPLFAAGHWVPDMVRRAGGIDVLATSGEHSRTFRVEEIAAAEPELLVFAPCGYPLERAAAATRSTLALPEWEWARGLRLAAMDGNALTSRPGPRLVDGVEVMARLFNPDLFSPMPPGTGAVLSPM